MEANLILRSLKFPGDRSYYECCLEQKAYLIRGCYESDERKPKLLNSIQMSDLRSKTTSREVGAWRASHIGERLSVVQSLPFSDNFSKYINMLYGFFNREIHQFSQYNH